MYIEGWVEFGSIIVSIAYFYIIVILYVLQGFHWLLDLSYGEYLAS